MQRQIKRGAAADAGLIFHVFAQDSASTTGAGIASIAFGSWACRYIRTGEAISGAITPQDITTIGTYAAPTANTNIRIKAVDNTNMIGVYELQIHLDWVNTTNTCQALTIYLTATGVAVLPIQLPLVAVNPQDTVRYGLTALPNAAADAAGGLPISDAGGLDLDSRLDAAVSSRLAPTVAARTLDITATGAAGVDWANVENPTTTLDLSGTTVGIVTALATAERSAVADAILNRDLSTGTDSGSPTVRTTRQALRFLRNKWSIAAGTLTVTKEDDTTTSWTAAVTTDAAADPIIGNDPAS